MPRKSTRTLRRWTTLAMLGMLLAAFPVAGAQAKSQERITAEINAFVLKNPKDFVGLDKLAYKYTGEHISVGVSGYDQPMTAKQAQAIVDGSGDGMVALGLPNFQIYVTSIAVTGGRQFWGTWDFPNAWAGQAAPVDIAQLSFQMHTCFRMSDYRIYTYSTVSPPGSTNLGTLRNTGGFTGGVWNVADRTSGFQNLADRGTATITVKRGTGCPSAKQQIAAAFDYESNQGGGVVSVSPNFGIFTVNYSGDPLVNHLGTPPIYVNL